MILPFIPVKSIPKSVLHVCGDDPFIKVGNGIVQVVFSTYVEMILNNECQSITRFSVLHVCGDDPGTQFGIRKKAMCSPRMWR